MKTPALTRIGLLALAACSGLYACDRGEPALDPIDTTVEYGSGSATVHSGGESFALGLYVAETEQTRSRGLMMRESLAPDSGMIFLFDEEQPPEAAFYMFNTLIPLSIAFMDEEGRIGSIIDMEPCTSEWPQWCHNYPAGVAFRSALEVNQGYFAEHGIEVGDTVEFEES